MEQIGIVADVVTIIGFPLALLGLWLAARRAAKDRSLAVTLSLIDSFRSGWERSWGGLLRRLEAQGGLSETTSAEDRRELFYILNWIDWLGCFIADGSLRNPQLIFDALGPHLQRAIAIGEAELKQGEAQHGTKHWRGVRHVQRKLG